MAGQEMPDSALRSAPGGPETAADLRLIHGWAKRATRDIGAVSEGIKIDIATARLRAALAAAPGGAEPVTGPQEQEAREAPAWEMQMVSPDMGGRHQYRFGPRRGPGGVTLRCTSEDAERLLAAVNHALAAPSVPARQVDEGDGLRRQTLLDAADAIEEYGEKHGDPADNCYQYAELLRARAALSPALEPAPETERGEAPPVPVVVCSMCGGDGDRESESGSVITGGCRTCSGRGVVADWSAFRAAARPSRQEPDTGEEGGR